MIMRRLFIIGLAILTILLYGRSQIIAGTATPHDSTDALKPVYCNDCHSVHKAQGTSLTNESSNENLCLFCHSATGIAVSKPFNKITDQATPNTSGTSHRWDRSIAAGVAPLNLVAGSADNPYGLRTSSEISNTALTTQLAKFNNVVTCSVCHNQHAQSNTPWDPNAPGSGSGRHFQRLTNDLNQMCEDCHYYRTTATSGTDVRAYDGKKKSHPVVKDLTADVDATQFIGAAPLEPNYNPQTTAPRYHQNGTGDTNTTNNTVLDSSSKVRCMSCHGIHYTDSDSSTTDSP